MRVVESQLLLLEWVPGPLDLEASLLQMLEVPDPMKKDSNMTWRKEMGKLRVRCSKAGCNNGYNTK